MREELHHLVDLLPDSEQPSALRFLRFLLDEAGFDPEPLSPREAAEAETAWQAHVSGEGPGEPLDKVRAELTARHRG